MKLTGIKKMFKLFLFLSFISILFSGCIFGSNENVKVVAVCNCSSYESKNETIYLERARFLNMHPITIYDKSNNKLYICYMDYELPKLEYNYNQFQKLIREYKTVINYLVNLLKQYNHTVNVIYIDNYNETKTTTRGRAFEKK